MAIFGNVWKNVLAGLGSNCIKAGDATYRLILSILLIASEIWNYAHSPLIFSVGVEKDGLNLIWKSQI